MENVENKGLVTEKAGSEYLPLEGDIRIIRIIMLFDM
jgi:hypothetical protein